MNRKQIALSVVLIAFGVLEAYAIETYGYFGFFQALLGSLAGIVTGIDLVIALVLFAVWMSDDAPRYQMSPIPYLLVTLALGSLGPLLYLIRRSGNRDIAEPALGARPLHS
jgi:hypothetical protein